ncbi:hypothetical protein RR48_00423 [Papilio machaon]|uniref:Uncharacterized protein n=1 Tax=Papilio machaon TaxID=76193 RepID=A0A0N1IQM0_PAPMA|nr:hypothetical protein RR48_00423 [Papilio machaon]
MKENIVMLHISEKYKSKKRSSPGKRKAARGAYTARGATSAAGSRLGNMPVPRSNTAVSLNTRPGVFKTSKLNLI